MAVKRKQPKRKTKPAEEPPFWQAKSLTELTPTEWERLCDGCGKCCLHKLEDVDTGEISYTNVACRLLDLGTCRCMDYKQRRKLVHDCLVLSPKAIRNLKWLPPTCAYRLVDAGKELYWWHHLVSGDPETVHQAGMSAKGKIIAERDAGDLEDHIVEWKE